MNAEQLKNSILQRAIEGKLVEQREEEGTAAELLREIKAEKARLVKEGKLKKEKPLPEIKAEEIPFEIPESWEWVRLGNIGVLECGSGLKRNETTSTGKPCIRYGELYTTYRTRFTTTMSFTSPEVFEQCRKVSKNDIVMSLTGENKHDIAMAVAYEGDDEIAMGGDMARWFAHGMNPLYLTYLLNSPYGISSKQMRATGNIIVHISGSKLSEIPLPIPPLAEQKRIVAKIEELLPRVEQYGKAHDELTALNEKFPDAMKKSVLQYAMEGKLVEQREEEGTAKELLTAIKAEKAKLVKEGKLKKEKPLPEIKAEELPFEIPESWEWVRLGEITSILGDGIHGTPQYDDNGSYYFINGNNLNNGRIIIKSTTKTISKAMALKYKLDLNETTCFVSINGTIGNTAFYNNEPVILGKSACYFNLMGKIEKKYINQIIVSDYFMRYALAEATGTTIKNVSLKAMRNFLLPLPPLAEQKRIVAKIEELLACCGRWKTKPRQEKAGRKAPQKNKLAAHTFFNHEKAIYPSPPESAFHEA